MRDFKLGEKKKEKKKRRICPRNYNNQWKIKERKTNDSLSRVDQ